MVKKSLNPTWDASFEFSCFSLTEAIEDPLSVRVYDYDGIADRADKLGQAEVDLHALDEANEQEWETDLIMPPPGVRELSRVFTPILNS